jgi:hypothetical protein
MTSYCSSLPLGCTGAQGCYKCFILVKVTVQVKLPPCVTKNHAMKTQWVSGGIAAIILNLGTRWRWVVGFTPRLLSSGVSLGTDMDDLVSNGIMFRRCRGPCSAASTARQSFVCGLFMYCLKRLTLSLASPSSCFNRQCCNFGVTLFLKECTTV